jgi:hypothetical protein
VGGDLLTWTSEMISAIVPDIPRDSYQNFPNRPILDWKQEHYAENYQRLVKVETNMTLTTYSTISRAFRRCLADAAERLL